MAIKRIIYCISFALSGMLVNGQILFNGVIPSNPLNVCIGDTLHFTFNDTLNPAGSYVWGHDSAVYSGPNTNSTYTVWAANSSLTEVYISVNGIAHSDTVNISVNTLPFVSFQIADRYVCHDDSPFPISGGAPANGYYTGNAVLSNQFSPSLASSGWNVITYNYTDINGCTGFAIDSIFVHPPLNPNIIIDGSTSTASGSFNGQNIWFDCVPGNIVTINFITTLPNNVATYVIDFGDGSNLISGIGTPPSLINHTYQGQGLYNGLLTLVSDSGCTTQVPFGYFFGSNPSIGLGNPGSTTGCIAPGDSLTYTFLLNNYSGNPPGTIYVVEFNDGSSADTIQHPPPPTYSHTFYSTSCGASPQGASPNTFFCRISATNPCLTTIATVEPIIISERSISLFSAPNIVCVGNPTSIADMSQGGTNVANNGGSCDTTLKIIWKIQPSSFTLSGSSSLGNQPGGSLNPNVWASGSKNLSVTFSAPGIYTVTQIVGIAGGCGVDSTVQTICVQEEIIGTNITTENLSPNYCSPSTYRIIGSPPANSFCQSNSYQWFISPANYSLDSSNLNSSQFLVTFNSAGTYTVGLTKSNSCSSETVYDTVIIRQAPFIQFIDSVFYCNETSVQFFGQTAHTPLYNNGNDITSFQYTITPAVGWTLQSGSLNTSNPAILFSQSGVYAVTLTATNSCGSDQSTQYISIAIPPSLALTIPDTICNGEFLNASLAISGQNNPYQSMWIIGSDTIFGNALSGIALTSDTLVQIQVSDSRGCITTLDTTIRVYSVPIIIDSIPAFCDSDTIVSSLTISGGESPFTFQWNTSAGLSDPTLLNPAFFGPSVLSSYTLIVIDRIGCQYIFPFTIFTLPSPQALAGPDTTICPGNTLVIGDPNASPANFYFWTNSDSSFSSLSPAPSITPFLTTDTYYLEVTNIAGCISRDTVHVDLSLPPSVSLTIPDSVCVGSIFSASASASGVNAPYSYSWTIGGSQFNGNSVISPTISGDVAVQLHVTDIRGCETLFDTTVYIHNVPILDSLLFPFCVDDTIQFSFNIIGGEPPFQYQWNTSAGISDSTILNPLIYGNLVSNPYVLTVSDRVGCEHSYTINFPVIPLPTAFAGPDTTICSGDSIILGDPISNLSFDYYWINSDSSFFAFDATPSISPILQNDIYYLEVTSGTGCVSRDTVQVSLSIPPQVSITIPDSVCVGSTFSASASASGVNAPYSYSWTIGGSQFNGNSVISPTISGDVAVQLHVTDIRGCDTLISKMVYAYNEPTFTSTLSAFCIDDSVQFTFNITGGEPPFQYQWNTSVGISDSAIGNPWIYGSSVANPYVLTVTDRVGCVHTFPINFPVTPLPIADAGPDTMICLGDSVMLGNPLSDPSLNYYWTSNPPGFTNNQKNPFTTPVSVNTTYYLEVSTGINCINRDSIIVQLSIPNSDFFIPDTVCSREIISLNDTNSNVALRQWLKNGILFSTNAALTDSVLNYGPTTASVTYELLTTNIHGCDSSTSKTVYVRPEGKLSFFASNVCHGDTINLYAQSISGYSFSSIFWEFGNGLTASGDSVSHYYLNPGSYSVIVSGIDQYGCDHQDTGNVVVYANPISNFALSSTCNADTVCVNKSYTFNDLSQAIEPGAIISNRYWDFNSDGIIESTIQSPSYSFPNSGLQQVRLIVESSLGCLDTLEREYYVLETLIAEVYLSEDSVCGPYVISDSIYTIGHIENYEWQLYRFSSSGSKIIEFVSTVSNPVLPTAYSPPGGNYTWYWSLEVSNCCDTIVAIDSVQIGSIPIPNFQISPDTGCSPLLVDFQLDGLIQGSPDYILLDFGDGITDSLTPTPLLINGVWQYIWGQMNHVYQYTGTSDTVYNATVFISNGCGDSSMTIPVFVQANTVQSFFNSNTGSGCSPLTVNFNNFSFSATNFTWCFDYDSISGICNGAVSNAPNPSHTFYTPGTYVVSLISDNGCSYDTAYQIITVSSGISAQINPVSDHCNGSPISLSVQILNSPTISSYYWDFGDGQVSTLSNPNHTYSAPGNYTISLALQTISGCVDTFYTSSTVIAKPTAEFGYYNLCFNSQPIQFFDSTVANGTMISGTLWDFGDGNSSTLINPVHSYSAPGTYIVELIKFNAFGCSDTIQHQVIIYPEPQLAFQPILISSDTCGLPQTYEFVNLSTNSFGYYWDFDFSNAGTSTSTLNQPTFSFTQAGTYTLALVGSNAFGCSDTIYQTLEIRPPVTSFFTINPETACEGIVFSFQDISQSDSVNDPIVNWIWDFGDGNSIFGSPAVQHTYQLPGVYIVQLSVETASGCTDNTYTSIAQVLEKPTASIGIGNQAFHQITFENNSLFIAGNPIFIWDFGDGYASSDFEPSHVYQSSGEYWVQFVIENENGCKDSTLIRVFIDDSFTIFIPNSFTPNEDGKNEIFYVQGMGIDEIQIEIFNRWGQRVFYSNDLALGWDGLIDGKEANQDTYVVRVSAKNYLFNKIEKKTSLLHLIR